MYSTSITNMLMANLVLLKIYGIYATGQLYTSDANNTYYIDFEFKFTWFDGQIACSRMNMTLVEINTSTKCLELNTLIRNIQELNNIKGDFLWIGGIRTRFPNQNLVWLSTGEAIIYSNWFDNNPDFYNNKEFCVEMVRGRNWQWNDNSCITKGGFVCEHRKEQPNEKMQYQFQLQDLQEQKLKLEKQLNLKQEKLDQLQDQIKHLQDIEATEPLEMKIKSLLKQYKEQTKKHKSVFKISQLQDNIKELQSSEENDLGMHTKNVLKTELQNNGQNVLIMYSPYSMFFYHNPTLN